MSGMALIDERQGARYAGAVAKLLSDRIRSFRLVSLLEGISYLLLLGVAMPLKYLGDEPILVRVIGPIHGALFIAYVIALVRCSARFSLARSAAYFVASLLPFAAFAVEWQLRRERPAVSSPT
jgi:integral membrane protein